MDKELIILEQIQNNSQINQRDLATIAHVSLGMTNVMLKKIVEKGFVTIQKVNNRNIRYALTAEGINEIKNRSLNYFKRTIKNILVYQDAITEIVKKATEEDYHGVCLIGNSDLEFMIEYVCYKMKIPYKKSYSIMEGWYVIYSENEEEENYNNYDSSFSLFTLI